MVLLRDINWQLQSEHLLHWINDSTLTIEQLQSGLEGEVYKLTKHSDQASIVYKVWNRTSKPNVIFQYQLLQQLSSLNIPVSKVYGCGSDKLGNPILVTSFDGFPLREEEDHDITIFAQYLSGIHNIPVHKLNIYAPETKTFDNLVNYFFPGIESYPDIMEAIKTILHNLAPVHSTLIHGDYNLGNIVHNNGSYCLIDWTNAQISDSRYDFAWASFLIRIYLDHDLYDQFKDSYLKIRYVAPDDYNYFECLAFLRWVLLSRIANIPMKLSTPTRIKQYKEEHFELLKNISI